jgi:hypothetical protein
MKHFTGIITKIGLGLTLAASCAVVFGQTVVDLPSTSQTTTLDANVVEQAQVTVPATINFAVNNISIGTASAAQSVTINYIVLATATKQLEISIQGAAATFTPPVALATTYAVGDVSWNAASWTAATGATGTLSNTAYGQVATCTAGVATCSTTALVFTLAPETGIQISGTHSLVINWKFESIGS